jgi:alpha-L-fucosidase
VIEKAAATAKAINERERTRDESGSRAPSTEGTYGGAVPYEPTLESLRGHPVPPWFANAKFGIFIHWGVFSIPAWAPTTGGMFDQPDPFRNTPYTEWYLNSLALDGSPVQAHHRETYGGGYPYDAFAPEWKEAIAGWDPTIWADLFEAAGARYVVLVTKHHDGFLLWPSAHPNPFKDGWHSERDLVGELGEAVRARGLTYGLYYSGGLDWTFGGLGIDSMRSLVAAIPQSEEYGRYADAHWRELIERYDPAVLWNDIGYPEAGNSPQLFADYYNAHPDGVVNNRFDFLGVAGGTAHADFTTPEYAQMDDITAHKWEACRGIGHSFGLNRNAPDDDLLTVDALVHLLADIVSKNGNLLLNVGPAADGRVPHAQAERLLGLGWWLRVNGEAIFDTTPWTRAVGSTAEGFEVRFTHANGAVYVIVLGRPATRAITIRDFVAGSEIEMLGHHAPLDWRSNGGDLEVTLPAVPIDTPAVVLRVR